MTPKAEICPWCGTNDDLGLACTGDGYQDQCFNCGARGPLKKNRQDSHAAWNTRSDAHLLRSHDKLKACLEAVRRDLQDIPEDDLCNSALCELASICHAISSALTEAAALDPQKEQP